MIALEMVLKEKNIYIVYSGLERYVSVCNYNVYFNIGGDTQM